MSPSEEIVKNALASVSPAEACASRVSHLFPNRTLDCCTDYTRKSTRFLHPRNAGTMPTAAPRKPQAVFDATSVSRPTKRAKKVVNALENAKELPNTDYKTLWASKAPIFQSCVTDALERSLCLVQGIKGLEKGHSLSAYALRLCLLFFSHDSDRTANSVSKEECRSGSGTKRMSVASD